jgi:hypothetical protein
MILGIIIFIITVNFITFGALIIKLDLIYINGLIIVIQDV